MKKLTKILGTALVLGLGCVAFTSCGSSANAEDIQSKIDEKINDDDESTYYTYDECVKAMGKNLIENLTVVEEGQRYGRLVCAEGCKSLDDLKKKVEKGETVKVLVVFVRGGNCTECDVDNADSNLISSIEKLVNSYNNEKND